ncbi:LytR/AlgR family response regulator transcription factor [Portibacter marinus]|uniref:LytR/AlgR family response regulator transcription factor n=1 Tax=Portibacter marinus TaxID=2898660 RepID=UPI001F42EDCB|nr:LytTR family DNA-binding domain-containing protein [Portibacter marinus]
MKVVKLSKDEIANPLKKIDFRELNRLVIKSREGCTIVPFKEIIFLKSDSNYSEIHTDDNRQHVASKTLKSMEDKLNHLFVRVHQSYIVNILHVREYSYSEGLKLLNNQIIPVSNSMKKKVSMIFK